MLNLLKLEEFFFSFCSYNRTKHSGLCLFSDSCIFEDFLSFTEFSCEFFFEVFFATYFISVCFLCLSYIASDAELRVASCSGCNSTYVGQTVGHVATRVNEHRKRDFPVGKHLLECNKEVSGTAELTSDIIDQKANTHKLHTLEALHIWRERPRINTRNKFSSRKLTLKL